jgi:aryl-alcohol dehydrogenase-like predicted oxidoreductase
MDMRPLGKSGLTTAPWAFGGNVFGWTADQDTSFKLLDAFVDGGFNLIDTADVYSAWVPGHTGGESETVMGAWFAARPGARDKVLVATKLGMLPPNNGLSATQIETAVEASLKRLQTDRIDLYQSHKDDTATPLEETLTAYDRLIKAGKVRAIGASNYDSARLGEALKVSADKGVARYDSLQPAYNLMDRAIEAEIVPLCQKADVAIITYYSLASGFLSGKYRSADDLGKSPRGGGIKKYLTDKGFAVLKALDEVSEARAATPTQVAAAWVMAKPGITAAIASATSLEQMKDLTAAAHLTLSADDMAKLDKASA